MSAFTPNVRTDQADDPRVNYPRAFHTRLSGFAPTPLHDLPELASALGVARIFVKDETSRLDTPSMEILGASWALYVAAVERLGYRPDRWADVEELRHRLAPIHGTTRVVVVSDNSFGLAAVRSATLFGLEVVAFVPETMSDAMIGALTASGALVRAEGLGYDDALMAAAAVTNADDLVLADTSWEGFTDIPRWVSDGLVTVFEEIADELDHRDTAGPGLVVMPLGSGTLAAAASRYLRSTAFDAELALVGAEPDTAACFSESVGSGERTVLPAAAPTSMTALGRGRPSAVAHEPIMAAFDGFVTVSDDEAAEARQLLSQSGVVVNASGAAAVAAVPRAVEALPESERSTTEVIVVCSERDPGAV